MCFPVLIDSFRRELNVNKQQVLCLQNTTEKIFLINMFCFTFFLYFLFNLVYIAITIHEPQQGGKGVNIAFVLETVCSC